MTDKEREVVVYSSPMCAPCEALKSFIASHGVKFKVRDLLMDEDARDRLEEVNIRSTPALEVDGKFYVGEALSRDNVKQLLGL